MSRSWGEDEELALARLRRRAARRRRGIDRQRLPDGVEGDDVPVGRGRRVRGVPAPVPLEGLVDQVVASAGWGPRLVGARVHDAWPEIVGVELARRCRPVAIRGDVLVLEAVSPPWAVELRHMERDLCRGVRRVLEIEVTRVEVRVASA